MKIKCSICQAETDKPKEVLMMGPNGFRRYPCCAKCAKTKEAEARAYQKKIHRANKNLHSGIAS